MSINKKTIPNNWTSVLIPEVLFFQEGPGVRKTQFRDKGVKLVNVGNINNREINLDATKNFIDEKEAYDKYPHFLLDEGDLLIACSGIVVDNFHNKLAFIKKEHLPLCLNTSTMRFKSLDEKVLDINYFKIFLQSGNFKEQLRSLITGSAQLNFGPSHIKQIELLLPPLEQQKKIAAILDAADELRQKDKALIAKYDELTQALFLDMFGGHIKDESNHRDIDKIAKFIDYRGKTPTRVINGVPFISAKCVRQGYFDKERLDYITEETYSKLMTRGFPKVGDVMFTTEGATMGFTCRIPFGFDKFSVGQRLITLQVYECYNNIVLDFMLNSLEMQTKVFNLATGSAVKGIRSAKFAKIKIPVPPIKLQNQFAESVKVIEEQKSIAQASAVKSEELFNSLLQKAFNGELV